MKSKKIIIAIIVSLILIAIAAFSFIDYIESETWTIDKPVIYLYPEEETDVTVTLDLNGELTYTYPSYNNGWSVTAYADGTLISNDTEYSYLFWEATMNVDFDFSTGFVVKGEDVEEFLIEKLSFLGLTAKEYNDFIVYWVPQMIENEYNLISFQSDVYTDNAVLNIYPEPDSVLRVFMAYKAIDEEINIPEQDLQTFTRVGFTVVEWGGTEVFD